MTSKLIIGLDLCANCEKLIDGDNYHVVDDEVNWCCECFHQKYDTCENCLEDFEYNDIKEVYNKEDYTSEYYCQWCYEELKKSGDI